MCESGLGREERQFDTGWPRGDGGVIQRQAVAGSQATVLGGVEGQAVGEPVRTPVTAAPVALRLGLAAPWGGALS